MLTNKSIQTNSSSKRPKQIEADNTINSNNTNVHVNSSNSLFNVNAAAAVKHERDKEEKRASRETLIKMRHLQKNQHKMKIKIRQVAIKKSNKY
jgi:hypothetical protein